MRVYIFFTLQNVRFVCKGRGAHRAKDKSKLGASVCAGKRVDGAGTRSSLPLRDMWRVHADSQALRCAESVHHAHQARTVSDNWADAAIQSSVSRSRKARLRRGCTYAILSTEPHTEQVPWINTTTTTTTITITTTTSPNERGGGVARPRLTSFIFNVGPKTSYPPT